MWSFTGADNQLWKWSESGNMLINVASGKPFAVGGFTEWRVARPKQGDILETQFGNKVGQSIHDQHKASHCNHRIHRLLMRGWPETTAVEVLLLLGKSTEMEANGSLLSLSTNLSPTQVWIVHQLLLHLPLLLNQQPLQHQQPLQLHQQQPCQPLSALSVLSALTMEATLRLRSSSSRTSGTPT